MARWFVDRSAQRGIPSVSLRRLLPGAKFVGCDDVRASGCSADSRKLDPGQVFVALKGSRHDGHEFVARAVARGAAAVVVERPVAEAGPIQVVVADSRQAHARLCHALAGEPSRSLRVVGVTGITGRHVTTTLLRAIYEADGQRFGVVGERGWSDGVNAHPPGAEPPGPEELAEMMAAMIERGCSGGAVEVDGEALDAGRIEGVAFDAAIVTEVGGPGPDWPAAAQARRRSLARLARRVTPGGTVVVNADDPDADLIGAVNLATRPVSYGLSRPADVTGQIERLGPDGTCFTLRGLGRDRAVRLRLLGPRCVSHALAAAALAATRGVAIEAIVAGLESLTAVPGRLEPVALGQPFAVCLERGGSERDLRVALSEMRAACAGRVFCVLSAGASPSLPAALGRAAEDGADSVIATLTGPMLAEPDAALDALLAGCKRPGRVLVEPDRLRAIEHALDLARPGDGVLIVGPGLSPRGFPQGDRGVVNHWLRRGEAKKTA